MTKLSVNVNKIATLRNTRAIGIPSVTHACRMALDAQAHGITIHPRPDERHIRAGDVAEVAAVVAEYPLAELNIEGNPFFPEYVRHIETVRPTQCTLVPDDENSWTSDHGWDLRRDGERLAPIIARLRQLGARVSIFLDADPDTVPLAAALGAQRIELYTAPYAEAWAHGDLDGVLERYRLTALAATYEGLDVNAGHDLSLDNLPRFLKTIPEIKEVSIGHALIADALEFGLPEAVRKYLALVD